jgi:hypothetical protein
MCIYAIRRSSVLTPSAGRAGSWSSCTYATRALLWTHPKLPPTKFCSYYLQIIFELSRYMFRFRSRQILRAAAVLIICNCDLACAGEGIWKAVVPRPGTMHGEFENNDPIGLYAGVRIKADCSVNWVNPDDHKLYCFSSATSLVFFLDAPASYLAQARNSWRKLHSTTG